MARTKISEFSATPGNNTDIDSINIAEGCAPSGINDAIRELMAQLKDFQTGAVGDSFNGPVGTTTAAAGAFTTLAASGAVTLSGGTANGVPYLNGSKVLTSGSALVFDGTNLGIGTSSPGAQLQLNRSGTGDYTTFRLSNSGASGKTYEIGVGGNTAAAGYANNLYFYDSTAGALRMTLDASGNLGLGVTPSAWGGNARVLQGAIGGSINFNSAAAETALVSNGYYNGSSWIYNSSANASRYAVSGYNGTHSWYTAPSGTAGAAITFTQSMTLNASGNLLVGTTSGTDKIVVNQSAVASASQFKNNSGTATAQCVVAWHANTSGDNIFHQFFTEASATSRGSISYNRGSGVVAYNTTSDYRAKDISGPVAYSGSLIDSVPVYMGKMKGATQERPMFIAHEVPAYAHTGEKDAVDAEGNPVYQQMDASALIPVMWAEIQSLRQRLAALEAA